MTRTPITSSHLRSVGYDAVTRTLEIEFSNGDVYQYSNVSEPIYTELLVTKSVGRYFHTFIKGRFLTTKLGVVDAPGQS